MSIRPVLLAAGASLTPALLGAASLPTALGQVEGGLWEITSDNPRQAVVRQCLADPAMLARFEHRSRRCETTVVRNSPGKAEIDYVCPAGNFGRSEMVVITPRSMRVTTQGISSGEPFHYVLQARRVGDCPHD